MISKKQFNEWATGIINVCHVATCEDGTLAAFVRIDSEWVKICPIPSDRRTVRSGRKAIRQFLLSHTNILCDLHNRI